MAPLSTDPQTVTSSSTCTDTNRGLSSNVHSNVVVQQHDQHSAELFSTSPKSTSAESAITRVVWRNVVFYGYLHLAAVYGTYLMFTSALWQTNLFALLLGYLSTMGLTAGVHRLWSHRTYKAKLPLRIFLALCYTMAFQNDIFTWVRNHRVHHKYSETDADPHNAKRGFFFAHVGWIMCRKHPDVIKKGQKIDLSDVLEDPVVQFQKKYYKLLVLTNCFLLPTVLPMYFWQESFLNSFLVAAVARFVWILNLTFLVNSAAHLWGQRPYDDTINPRDNYAVVLGTIGEGFHNYHHTFPYDYAASEFGIKYNLTTMFIDAMAWVGLAYDRKTASKDSVLARKIKTGGGKIK